MISGHQFQQIEAALLNAFRSKEDLSMMLRHQLDLTLDHVASGSTLAGLIHNLVAWAETHGKVHALIEAAVAENSGNPSLQQLRQNMKSWSEFSPDVREGESHGAHLPQVVSLTDVLVSSTPGIPTVVSDRYLGDVQAVLCGQAPEAMVLLNPSLGKWLRGQSGWMTLAEWDHCPLRPVVGLVDDPVTGKVLPFTVDLLHGHVVLIGGYRWGKSTFLRSLTVSLAASHSPDLVHIFLLDLGERQLGDLASLPQVGAVITPTDSAYEERVVLLFNYLADISEIRKGILATTGTSSIYEYNSKHPLELQPSIVVAIDNIAEFYETFGRVNERSGNAYTQFISLVRSAEPVGIHFVVTAHTPSVLSQRVLAFFSERLVLRLNDSSEYRAVGLESVKETPAIAGRGYHRKNAQSVEFQLALPFGVVNDVLAGELLSTTLANMHRHVVSSIGQYVEPFRANPLPAYLPFSDIVKSRWHIHFDDNFIDQISPEIWRHWEASIQPDHTEWLTVPIGYEAIHGLRSIRLSAKDDGVHGMVAGGNRSGKSEFLRTFLTSLALRYDPTVVNFVLVECMGSSALDAFSELPHFVDMVTNYHADNITRMFMGIDSELRRRQALNTETGTKDILEYRQKGLHVTWPDGSPGRPYPFLIIVINEFSEMIADRTDVRDFLESLTRVGRAQGVHLLLVAEHPAVTEKMRLNLKYRVCFRVDTPAVSQEVIGLLDAAFISAELPGRAFLQIGRDKLETIQVAYVSEPCDESSQWFSRESPELYRVLIRVIAKVARDQGRPRQRAPWPDFLPESISLTQVLVANDDKTSAITSWHYLENAAQILCGQSAEHTLSLSPAVNKWLNGEDGWIEQPDWENFALRPVVGLVDDPFAARQIPLVIDLPQGHAVLIGGSGWGKTVFVRTLAVSLAANHTPDHVHIYVLDLGGRNLAALAALPHVGSVISTDDEGYEERVAQLFRDIDETVYKCKDILAASGATSLFDYNRLHPDDAQPALVIVIDNFVEFRETFDRGNDEIEDIFDQFVDLARRARPYGVHFVVTAHTSGAIPQQVFNLFSERLVLRLNDPSEYRAIVPGAPEPLPPIAGRGYVKIGAQALTFQIAQPFDLERTGVTEAEELAIVGRQMHAYMAGARRRFALPIRIDPLPKGLLFKRLLARLWKLDETQQLLDQLRNHMMQQWQASKVPEYAEWPAVPLGVVTGNRLRTLCFDAKRDGVHGLLAGGTGSGKSELLMTLIVGFALQYDPSVLNFVLVDFKGGGAFRPFEKMPHVVDVATNLHAAGVQRMFMGINAELQRRQELNTRTHTKDIIEYRAKGFHLRGLDGAPGGPYPHLFVIIDEYAEMIAGNPEFKDALDSITRTGRALGVHLLLAAQRPIGVTDQMRANIKLRICLRVEETDTSREMLRRPDAAFLPNGMPGRGYLQIGNDTIELIQVAYTGDDYTDPPYDEIREGARPPKFYDVVVDLAQALLVGERPRRPWPPPLPASWRLVDPLIAEYWGAEEQRQVTLGQRAIASLNPFLADWLAGRGSWPGIDWSTQAMRAVVGLVDDPLRARQLPLIVDLSRGHAVLFGASGYGKTTFLRTLVASLAATHTPAEFQAHILDLGGRSLEVLRELPHVGSLIKPDEREYEESVEQLLRELDNILEERKRLFGAVGVSTLFEYNAVTPASQLPAILIAIDNFSVFMETFDDVLAADGADTVLGKFVALVRQAKAYGIHCVITVIRLGALPTPIYSLFTERLTLRLAEADDYRAIVGGPVPAFEETLGRGYVKVGRDPLEFQVALAISPLPGQEKAPNEANTIRALGRAMHAQLPAAWQEKLPFRIEALPKVSDYRQVLSKLLALPGSGDFVGGLAEAMRRQWKASTAAATADWLQFVLGITAGNRPRTLHLEAKRDGVHGLIAGGTGSGKSELLMTMIVGMVVNYDPSILNLVLVDYKGGGAFKLFEGLPHVVEIVTNLNKAAVHRMFTAIGAEIRRRQQLNADTNTKDIVDYRKRGLHLTREPFPHLFIIIDEYAEMIDDNPEYKAELESITRVGRSIGVNLILASQRPKGVTDQMRANIKLRICLRVEELDTSREMLRRPDAALLPNGQPGRGYLQVGNENIELIQVSYTGDAQPDDRPPAVLWPDRPPTSLVLTAEELPKFYDTVMHLARELTHNTPAPKPWPGFLPASFSLETLLHDGKGGVPRNLVAAIAHWANDETADLWPGIDWTQDALRATVGLVDDPEEASQTPLTFDLSRAHLAIFGDPASGKTNLLRTLILSLAATHSPDELHVYVVDLGGRNFRALEGLPHVGTVIYTDEEAYDERFGRLLDMLDRTIAQRQTLLAEAGVNTIYRYNSLRQSATQLPAVLVVIDNFSELWDSQELLVENTLAPLIRRALAAGVTFVVASSGGSMASSIRSLFGQRITLYQSNPDRYFDLVGRDAIDFGAIPGRGYVRRDQRPLMFHAARPVGLLNVTQPFDAFAEIDEMQRIVTNMSLYASQGAPMRSLQIGILPELVPLQAMLGLAPTPTDDTIAGVIGQEGTLQPALVDLRRMGPHFTIVGPPFSGKTTVLYNWIITLALRYPPARVPMILVDMQRRLFDYGGRHKLTELPHVLATVDEIEELVELMPRLRNACAALAEADPPRELFIFIDNFDDFGDELVNKRQLDQELAQLARRAGRDGLHFVIAGSTELTIITAELRRRVQASNYGLGLRIGQALDTLRVNKRPAGMQNKELPIGRGYLVKAGAATLLQVATPYTDQVGETPFSAGIAATPVQALDGWVERILARYPDERALWGKPAAAITPADGAAPDLQFDLRTLQLIELLRRIAHKRKLADPAVLLGLSHRDVLLTFVRKALDEELNMVGGLAMFGGDLSEEDIIRSADGQFPEIVLEPEAGEGVANTEGEA
jgi:S-DNA-T family DNA segregation ATPase FtsK/SpoIIIE